jgi:PEP-CTERM motif-containing protein
VIQNWCKADAAGGAMKTLLLMTARGVRRFAILTLLLSPLALIPARTEANTISLGEIKLSGSFTVTPNNESFSSFGDLTVIQASGRFARFVDSGDALVMNTPFVLTQPSASNPIVWSIGGYTMNTTSILITGADIVGRNVFGLFDLSGHHFDHALHALDARGFWDFTTPPFDGSISSSPVTGPVTLTIHEVFDNGGHGGPKASSLLLSQEAFDSGHGGPKASSLLLSQEAFDSGHGGPKASSLLLSQEAFDNGHVVPEPSSLLLLACGLALLAGWRWKQQASATI